ncbi:hypothetical protein [Geobacter anodireducens]
MKRKVTLAVAASVVALMPVMAQAANKLIVKDATGTTDMFVVTDGGLVGSGTNAPAAAFHAKGNTYVSTQIVAHWNGINAGVDSRYAGGGFIGLYNGDNNALPLANNRLGYFLFGAANGAGKLIGSGLNFAAEKTWTTTSIPSYISFLTAPENSVNMSERVRITSAGNVGIGSFAPTQRLEVAGGVKLNTTAVKPACDANVRGTIWFTRANTGAADTLEVCSKDATENYAWRALY